MELTEECVLLPVLFSLPDQASFLYLPGHPAQCYHNPQWTKSVTAQMERYPGSQDPSTTQMPLGFLGLFLSSLPPFRTYPVPSQLVLLWPLLPLSSSGLHCLIPPQRLLERARLAGCHADPANCCCGFLVVPGTEGLGKVRAHASCPRGSGHFRTDFMELLGRFEFTEKANAPKGGRGPVLMNGVKCKS